MDGSTGWTPSPDANRLGLTDRDLINEHEAKGIAIAELFVLGLDSDAPFSVSLLLEIHRIAFSELYDWAGKWRTTEVTVGQFIPPRPEQVPQLMYQFIDNLNFRIGMDLDHHGRLSVLTYAHYEFVRIHPFNNGNGRTGRILMNHAAMKLGYRPLELYHREGLDRRIYIDAMRSADNGDLSPLSALIGKELTTL